MLYWYKKFHEHSMNGLIPPTLQTRVTGVTVTFWHFCKFVFNPAESWTFTWKAYDFIIRLEGTISEYNEHNFKGVKILLNYLVMKCMREVVSRVWHLWIFFKCHTCDTNQKSFIIRFRMYWTVLLCLQYSNVLINSKLLLHPLKFDRNMGTFMVFSWKKIHKW